MFSESQTIEFGAALGRILTAGDVILIEGELGSGKTRLAKGIISTAAGVTEDEVVSPTFTLINTFEGDFPVHHADLYRIESDQVEGIGLEETVELGGALVVEWAEKIPGFGDDALRIVLLPGGNENARRIVFQWHESGSWCKRLGNVLEFGS